MTTEYKPGDRVVAVRNIGAKSRVKVKVYGRVTWKDTFKRFARDGQPLVVTASMAGMLSLRTLDDEGVPVGQPFVTVEADVKQVTE